MAIGLYHVSFLVLNLESDRFTLQALVWLVSTALPNEGRACSAKLIPQYVGPNASSLQEGQLPKGIGSAWALFLLPASPAREVTSFLGRRK